jgi:hypothetical protein
VGLQWRRRTLSLEPVAPTPSYSAARQGPHQPSNGLGVPDPDASQGPNGPLGPLVERSIQHRPPVASAPAAATARREPRPWLNDHERARPRRARTRMTRPAAQHSRVAGAGARRLSAVVYSVLDTRLAIQQLALRG